MDSNLRLMRRLAGIEDAPQQFREEAGAQDSFHLMNASKLWRKVIKEGDNLLESVQNVVSSLEKAESEEFAVRRNQALVDVRNSVNAVQMKSKEVYADFALGRNEFYEAAKIWDMSTRRSGKGAKKSVDISDVDDSKLVAQAAKGSQNLIGATGKMLEAGAKASNLMSVCAKAGCPVESRKEVLDAALDFRDLVSEAMFARVNGVMRRSVLVLDRFAAQVESRSLYEAKEWVAPWERDAEIGDVEAI